MEKDDRIRQKLKRLDVEMDTLMPNLRKYIDCIEDVIISIRDEKNNALRAYTNCDYDVKSIAKTTGISRTTFYNYDRLLQRYIELSHAEDLKDDLFNRIKKLHETVRILQEEKNLMEQRDCKELLLEEENSQLRQQIVEKNRIINNLRKSMIQK